MATLSAPSKSGFKAEFATVAEVREKAAWLLDCEVADLVERESGDGATTYYYASDEQADADLDGAYAVQSRGEEDRA